MSGFIASLLATSFLQEKYKASIYLIVSAVSFIVSVANMILLLFAIILDEIIKLNPNIKQIFIEIGCKIPSC